MLNSPRPGGRRSPWVLAAVTMSLMTAIPLLPLGRLVQEIGGVGPPSRVLRAPGLGTASLHSLALAFVLSWLLPEVPMRTTTQATDVGQTFRTGGRPSARPSCRAIPRPIS